MKLLRFVLVVFLFCSAQDILIAQSNLSKQLPEFKKYLQSEVYDSSEGIKRYEKLNPYFSGDSMRYDPRGYSCSGWVEDFYVNGQVMHRGYYTEGRLKTYKNFYENGQLERHFRNDGFKTCQMTLYWDNGKIRSDIIYESSFAKSTHEYFYDGTVEYEEEFKKQDELMYRHIYSAVNVPELLVDLKDAKKLSYTVKEYHENGKLKGEGEMRFRKEVSDLMKEGDWKVYDETGKLTSIDTYTRGQVTESKEVK